MKTFPRSLIIGALMLSSLPLGCAVPVASEKSDKTVEVISAPEPVPATDPIARPLGVASAAAKNDESKKKGTTKKEPYTFKGIGNKDKIDSGFTKETKKKRVAQEGNNGVRLPQKVQDVVDKAGEIIDDIDESTLNAVNKPLHQLGLEAESAKLRPKSGGVGLGISIDLDKNKKKEVKSEKEQKEGSRKKVYELISPDDAPKTDTTTH